MFHNHPGGDDCILGGGVNPRYNGRKPDFYLPQVWCCISSIISARPDQIVAAKITPTFRCFLILQDYSTPTQKLHHLENNFVTQKKTNQFDQRAYNDNGLNIQYHITYIYTHPLYLQQTNPL